MNRHGPIIIIEDDIEDQEILQEVLEELAYKNEIVFFSDAEKALAWLVLTKADPFIIFSDVNMPKLSGMELRQKVHENEDMRIRSIPYLFFTTSADHQAVIDAYSQSVQGFFVKPSTFGEVKELMRTIVTYWQSCVAANYVK